MILNGKAKEDFEKWLDKEEVLYGIDLFQLPIQCENALIIEWFDSVGIGVDAYTSLFEKKLIWGADIIALFDIQRDSSTINLNLNCTSRQEATTKAIEVANSIYNSNN